MAKKKPSFLKFVYFDYEEIYDLDRYPILLVPSNIEGTKSELDIKDLKERQNFRKSKMINRKRLCANRNKDSMKELGKLIQIESEIALRDLQKQFTYTNEKGEVICFLKNLDLTPKDIPSDIMEIFDKYSDLVLTNSELKHEIADLKQLPSSVVKAIEPKEIENLNAKIESLKKAFKIYDSIFMNLNKLIKTKYDKKQKDAIISFMNDLSPIFPKNKEDQELLKKIAEESK